MNHKKILIIRLSAIGDTIHTLPLISAIKEDYPQTFIGWVVEKKALAFVKNNPSLDKVYILEKKNLTGYVKLINEIRKDNYDIAVDIQGLLKSAIIMFFSGAKRKIGFEGTREFSHLLASEKINAGKEFDHNTHVISRNLEVAKHLGCNLKDTKYPMPPCETDVYSKFLLNFDKSKPVITLSPATTWETKHWSEDSWSKVLDALQGHQVVFTGTKSDTALIDRIIENSSNKNVTVLAGQTNLLELAEIFKLSKIVITPDSGSAHIAVATKSPKVICLLGPTAENRNGAFDEEGFGHINLIKNVNCRPCYKKKCPKNGNKIECMLKIKAKDVLKNINEILNSN